MKKILIVGTPRSGTHYITNILEQVGHKIKHEHNYNGYSENEITGAVSFTKALHPENYDVVLHQVRNPLKTIKSMLWLRMWRPDNDYIDNTGQSFVAASPLFDTEFGQDYRDNLVEYMPQIKNNSKILQHAIFWYYWTKKCEQIADFTYRIEDFNKDNGFLILNWINKLGISVTKDELIKIVKNIPRDIAAGGNNYTDSEVLDMLPAQIKQYIAIYAQELGY